MNAARRDSRTETSYELRYEGHVVGPVSWDRIRRGRAAKKIPGGAQARSVGDWQQVDELLQRSDAPPAGAALPRNTPHEVRADQHVVGPVTLDQIRRGRALGKIPDGAEARVVGPWRAIDPFLDATEPFIRAWDPPPQRPTEPQLQPTVGDTQELPPETPQRWYLMLSKEDPAVLVDTDQLVDGLNAGAVTLSAEVCPVGGETWSPIWSVPELADVIRELPPASVRFLPSTEAVQQWYLEMPGADPTQPVASEWILENIRTGSVPISARICAVGDGRWLPVWDIVEFAQAIKQAPSATWRAREQAEQLFNQAEAAREPAAAIELYAAAAERFWHAQSGPEATSRVSHRIRARARGQISTLLAEGQPGKARAFLYKVRKHVLAVGLDECLNELDWRVRIALSDRRPGEE